MTARAQTPAAAHPASAAAGHTPPRPLPGPRAEADGEGTTYTVALPAGLPLLNANRSRREHWAVVRRLARDIRQASCLVARSQRIPLIECARIVYVVHPAPQMRRRDPSNWAESAKAAVDGLVDAGVVVDDDSAHVIGPDPRIGEPIKGGQLILHITPVGGTTP